MFFHQRQESEEDLYCNHKQRCPQHLYSRQSSLSHHMDPLPYNFNLRSKILKEQISIKFTWFSYGRWVISTSTMIRERGPIQIGAFAANALRIANVRFTVLTRLCFAAIQARNMGFSILEKIFRWRSKRVAFGTDQI